MKDEGSPLEGKRVVVTRAAEQAAELYERLVAVGAEPILLPTVQFVPLPSEPLAAAVSQLSQYDWLLFTSANAVDFFFRYVDRLEEQLSWPRLVAVGPATAAKLAKHGLQPNFVPDEYVGEALAAGLGKLVGQRVLLPRSRQGRPQLVEQLRSQGANVDEIAIYDTVVANPEPEILERIRQGIDAITFASPSSVHGFLTILDHAGIQRPILNGTVIVCIGPVTARQVKDEGLVATITAADHTAEGLVQALIDYYTTVHRVGAGQAGKMFAVHEHFVSRLPRPNS